MLDAWSLGPRECIFTVQTTQLVLKSYGDLETNAAVKVELNKLLTPENETAG